MNGIYKRTELSGVALCLVSNHVSIYNFPKEGWGDVVELDKNGWLELRMVMDGLACKDDTTIEIFNRGRQNRLIVAGNATATDERPRLIVALTVAVAQPPRLIC